MKITIEVNRELLNDEIVLRCRELTPEVMVLEQKLTELANSAMQLEVMLNDTTYYIRINEIYFVETSEGRVIVHTRDKYYTAEYKLYELDELLPKNFARASKSAIINTDYIRAIRKNITGASEIEFAGTAKKTYASRNYLKIIVEKLNEKRLGK